jgi:hypothetical protein
MNEIRFFPGDNGATLAERSFADCQTEEQAYLTTLAFVLHIPAGFVGANSAEAAMLQARLIVNRHKTWQKRLMLDDIAALVRMVEKFEKQ